MGRWHSRCPLSFAHVSGQIGHRECVWVGKEAAEKELGKRSKTMLRPVQVTFRNVNADAGLEKLVQQESDKLERFYERITSCRVMVERPQRAQSSKLYHVRIDLRLPRGELVVEHMPSLHAALKDSRLRNRGGKQRQCSATRARGA